MKIVGQLKKNWQLAPIIWCKNRPNYLFYNRSNFIKSSGHYYTELKEKLINSVNSRKPPNIPKHICSHWREFSLKAERQSRSGTCSGSQGPF